MRASTTVAFAIVLVIGLPMGCAGDGSTPTDSGPRSDREPVLDAAEGTIDGSTDGGGVSIDAGLDGGSSHPPGPGTERRCTDLGPGCVCSEPLDTATVNGGSAWTDVARADPDDSPDATECRPGIDGAQAGFSAVDAREQPLPPGHRLSWVVRKEGIGVSSLYSPDPMEARDVTYCLRSYDRWDPTSFVPGAGDGSHNSQYKIMTIGGVDPGGNHNPFQLGVTNGGRIYTRADSNWFDCPVDFSLLGSMQECQQNFCRFELCVDFRSTGLAQARFRQTILAPAADAGRTYEAVKPECLIPRDVMDFRGATGPMSWYGQDNDGLGERPAIRYATHALVVRQRPADGSFWPGAACEVEGGCEP